jgi:hypothetical protein
VISHQQNMVGRTYASIDAVSKPTKRVAPSGHYDPALARQRVAEWKAKEAIGLQAAPGRSAPVGASSAGPSPRSGEGVQPKSPAPSRAPEPEFDPEVGF